MGFEKIGQKENLPDRVVRIITESILEGEWAPGDLMPTEPELADQFGVSRSVIRDAVRMLIARGLVIVRHGKGMYVSPSQNRAFSDAVLLALRREKATAWDTEEFQSSVFAEIFALASLHALPEERERIRQRAEEYKALFRKITGGPDSPQSERELKTSFDGFMESVFQATHNKVFILLGQTMLDIRSFRDVDISSEKDCADLVKTETAAMDRMVEAALAEEPDAARRLYRSVYSPDQELIRILKNTPVGKKPEVSLEVLKNQIRP